MRISCNGCRVLRKGCSEDCNIRPCLDWIKSPESQANATLFLAKFYGRAGLINLINAGPQHLRPSIFKSLLYEACGRIINPIHGSTGLLYSNNWHLCQSAVDSVLAGLPLTPISADSATAAATPPIQAGDIRHVSKPNSICTKAAASDLLKANPVRKRRYKRSADSSSSVQKNKKILIAKELEFESVIKREEKTGSGGSMSHDNDSGLSLERTISENNHDAVSGETVEAELVGKDRDEGEVGLNLTLGLGLGFVSGLVSNIQKVEYNDVSIQESNDGILKSDLALGLHSISAVIQF